MPSKISQFSWVSSIQHIFRLLNLNFDILRFKLISPKCSRCIVDKATFSKPRHYSLFKSRFKTETYTKLKDIQLVKTNWHIKTGKRDSIPPIQRCNIVAFAKIVKLR